MVYTVTVYNGIYHINPAEETGKPLLDEHTQAPHTNKGSLRLGFLY